MSSTTSMAAPMAVSGLSPYSGPWGWDQAAHLLRRTLFGPKKEEIVSARDAGLTATLNQLLAAPTLPSPPVNHFFGSDPKVPVGETWVEKSHDPNVSVGDYRYPSIRGWYWQNLIHHDYNVMAKMTMFWINHFGMADVSEHRAEYQSIALFNEKGTGNFKTMIEDVTILPSMLKFLNGESNNKWTPNENYARELLELFTIQKGPQVATEDYTHYTEDDVRAAAQILTGWRNRGFWSDSEDLVDCYFDANRHVMGPKTMSYRFDNAVIGADESNAENEYKELIDVIFGKEETARAFCRELYRFFVYYDINGAVESQVIQPMAQMLIANSFEIKPVLRALFGSQHFYDMAVRGPMIKSPYEFIVSMARPLGGFSHLGLDLSGSDNLQTRYDVGGSHHWWANNMEMDFLYPPTVAGWKAYYQTPTFYRNWIGSATLKQRKSIANAYTGNGIYTRENGNDGNYQPRPFDWFAFVASLETPFNVDELIAECVQIFLPRELDPAQYDALKAQMLPGLPETEWSRQYGEYLASPFNPDVANPVRNKIRAFFRALFSLAEFNLQ